MAVEDLVEVCEDVEDLVDVEDLLEDDDFVDDVDWHCNCNHRIDRKHCGSR